jgi:hypothetical protein
MHIIGTIKTVFWYSNTSKRYDNQCLGQICSLNNKSIDWRCSISFMIRRNITPCYSKSVMLGIFYFYFSGLFLRRISKILSHVLSKKNHVSIWNWIQKYNPHKYLQKEKRLMILLLMKLCLRLVLKILEDDGVVLSLKAKKYLDSVCQKR